VSNVKLNNINKGMWHHILTTVGPGGTLLELGSGETSQLFVDHGLKVYSIEHDPEWVGKYPGVNYIHAPLVEFDPEDLHPYFKRMDCLPAWYDHTKVHEAIDGLKYDALLLDGPQRKFRVNFFLNHAMFDGSVPWFADDLKRPEWYRALMWTATERGRESFPEIHGLQTPHAWCKFEGRKNNA
jgi:hypothetical protein